MRLLRLVSVVTILLSTLVLAQSTSLTSSPLVSKDAALSQPDPSAQAKVAEEKSVEEKIAENYGKLPLSFEANHGQTNPQVKFLSRTTAYSLFLTGDEAVLTLNAKESNAKKKPSSPGLKSGHRFSDAASSPKQDALSGAELITRVLRMKLQNANAAAKVTGVDEQAATTNYFIGNDPAKWRTNVPTYAKVKYENIYSGIDLVYYGNQRQLEYDFIVAPGADPRRIAFDISGAKRIRKDGKGELAFEVGRDEIRWHKPVVYQERNGARHQIAARYAITETNRISFELAKYDVSKPLYIDPLIYSTYLGGGGQDYGEGIAVDSAGNAYVTGQTASTDFPTKNPLQPANHGGLGGLDAFVTKINAAGSALVYSSYLGGSGDDYGGGIALDSAGNVYVTGTTSSTDFPTKNPLQPTLGGSSDAFVAEINVAGSALVYSTYLGGSAGDGALGIALDSTGNAYVTGYTASADFPTKNPLQPTYGGGGYDGFVAKINSAGSALVYSTYLGGSGFDSGKSIAVDGAGNAYVTGNTASTDFPTKNPLQPANAGESDAFVTKFDPAGSALVYSTYLGGPEEDSGNGIAADSGGNAYVTGVNYTNQCNRLGCFFYEFADKIDPTGSAFVYRNYDVGNINYSNGNGIAVDSSGNAYLIGSVGGDTGGPVNRTVVEKLDPSGVMVGSATYLGGGCQTLGYGIATGGLNNAYVTGATCATRFPNKNALQPANAGGFDAFVTKIDMRIVTTTTLTSSPNPSTKGQVVTLTAVVSSKSGVPSDGETVSFMKGTTVLGTATLSGGTATFNTSSLPAGTTLIRAVYSGDSNFTGSKSNVVKQVVNKAAE